MSEISTSLISGFNSISSALKSPITSSQDESETSFSSVLTDALEQYNQLENDNSQATLDLLSGNTDDLATSMITSEKAEVALNLTIAIRNKAVEAYKEIMNMQV